MKRILLFAMCLFSLSIMAQRKKTTVKSKKSEQVENKSKLPSVLKSSVHSSTTLELETMDIEETNKVNKKENVKKVVEVGVNMDMVVQLVFKSPVNSVRAGLPDVVDVENVENTVTVQALDSNVNTNLIVKTADGYYYVFILKSSDSPKFFYDMKEQQAYNYDGRLYFESDSDRKQNIRKGDVVEKVFLQKGWLKSHNKATYKKVEVKLKGIYVNKDKLFFLFDLENKSNLKYEVNNMTFITISKKKNKKTVGAEEQEYLPMYFYKDLNFIVPNGSKRVVAVFQKFTLNGEKNLEITLSEKDGERVVRLKIKTDFIINAEKI